MRYALLAACLIAGPAWAADDPVVAQRGADQITVSQARALIGTADQATRQRLATDRDALKTFLRDALVQRAILEQAQTERWDQRPDVAALLRRAHDQVLAESFLVSHAPLPAGFPTEAAIQAAYDQNKARLMQPRSYHLLQLYLPKAASAAADDGRKRVLAVRAQIQHGKLAFDEAAKRTPGLQFADIGWVAEPQLAPAAKAAIAGLPEGALSDPLCGAGGCQLIRLVATRPAGPAPLSEAREALIRALKQQKLAEEERAYASGLLGKQPVAINEIQLGNMAP